MKFPFRSFSKTTAARHSGLRVKSIIAGGLFVALAGCDVTLFPEVVAEPTSNVCESDLTCGQKGECINSRCQTDRSQIPALLLEITPTAGVETPAGRPAINGLSFLSVINEFDRGPSGYEISLEHVSVVKGAVIVPSLIEENCLALPPNEAPMESPEAGDGSIPARLTFTPRQRLLGLPTPLFTAQSNTLVNVGDGLTGYQITSNIPPGKYDIYIEPSESVGGCVRPPFLIVNQEIPSGNVALDLNLPPPEVIRVTVRYPRASDDLKDWTLDIVQKDSGRLLSNRALLQEPVERAGVLEYDLELVFSTSTASDIAASEIVRLSPPEGVVAPTIYLERSLIDLFQEGTGLVDQLTELADPVNYRARVTAQGLPQAMPSTVTLAAITLNASSPGTTAGFSRTVETDDNGFFETQLLPGTYRALVVPLDTDFARRIVDLTVSDASLTQSGRTIEVTPRATVSGELISFDGAAVFGASIWANAVPSPDGRGVLEAAQGAIPLVPSAVGDVSGDDGSFSILADVGVFNISARPEPTTGFAWAVRLGVDISEPTTLSRLELPLPLVVKGRLTSSDTEGAVPGALIRAFALLKDGIPATSDEEADSVVAVGEARVNGEGRFELLLPSAFK